MQVHHTFIATRERREGNDGGVGTSCRLGLVCRANELRVLVSLLFKMRTAFEWEAFTSFVQM